MIPTLVGSEGGDFGVRVSLKPNFDGIITMNIFLNPGSATSYSWVSLQAVAFDKGSGSISTACLLGAQNVVLLRGEAGLTRGGGVHHGGRQRINVVPNQEGELERSDRDEANGAALPSFLLSPSLPLRQQMAQLFVVLLRARVYGQPTEKIIRGSGTRQLPTSKVPAARHR